MNSDIDTDTFEELKGLIGEKMQGLVSVYVRDTQEHLDLINAGLEAEDYTQIADAAHPAKSSSGNMGFTGLYLILRKIEEHANTDERNLDVIRSLYADGVHAFAKVRAFLKQQGFLS